MIRNYGICADCILVWFNPIIGNRNSVIFGHEIIRVDLEMRFLVVCVVYATLVVW